MASTSLTSASAARPRTATRASTRERGPVKSTAMQSNSTRAEAGKGSATTDATDKSTLPPGAAPSSESRSAPPKKSLKGASNPDANSAPTPSSASADDSRNTPQQTNQQMQLPKTSPSQARSDSKESVEASQEMSSLKVAKTQELPTGSAQSSSAPRRRESQRTRRPSSRMLPSPSPPPPRSSSYANWLKNRESATVKDSTTTTAPTDATDIASKRSLQQSVSSSASVSADAGTAAESDVASKVPARPAKRARRPSTMTLPPATITKEASTAKPVMAVQSTSAPKSKVARRSEQPEDVLDESKQSAATLQKAARKTKKAQAKGKGKKEANAENSLDSVHSGYESDENAHGNMLLGQSDDRAVAERSLPGVATGSTVSAMRMQSSLSNMITTSEPPPLISRRGGLKGSTIVHRASATSKSSQRQQPALSTPEHWSWNKSSMSIPLLRFKLDSLRGRHLDEEEESAAEDEDDFHVAMLDGQKYFDSLTDAEDEDAPPMASSIKSSPRASKSYDGGSDIDDTPATTPQSPQSLCDAPERRNSVDEETRASAEPAQNRENSVSKKSTPVRDTVFAHALEPSSTRPHTYAGSLTLSLPFEEMPQVTDEDASSELSKGTRFTNALPFTKVKEERLEQGIIISTSVHGDDETSMASELLGTSMASSLDDTLPHRQASLMLSSPNPISAFASPTLTSMQIHSAIKSEPAHLTLPPAVSGRHTGFHAARSKLQLDTELEYDESANDLESENGSQENDEHPEEEEEHHASLFSPPESMCLMELDRTWEQGECSNKGSDATTVQRSSSPDESSEAHSESEDDVEKQLRDPSEPKTSPKSAKKRPSDVSQNASPRPAKRAQPSRSKQQVQEARPRKAAVAATRQMRASVRQKA